MALAWSDVGNIKGPAGDVTGIPDPLTKGTIQATAELDVGTHFRIIPTATGAQLQTSPDGTTWTTQAEWP